MHRRLLWIVMVVAACLHGLVATSGLRAEPRIVRVTHEAYQQAAQTYGLDKNDEAVAKVKAGELDLAIASWWGFDANDTTRALQAAIQSGAATVVVPKMDSDWIVTPIRLTQNNQTILFEEGVTVRAKAGEFHARHSRLFNAQDRENLTLIGYGATLAMRREDYLKEPYTPGEHRHALGLMGCRNVKVLGLTLRDSGGDGIYIGRGPQGAGKNILIRHVTCDANHRQGISVITVRNLWIDQCVLSNTRGTRPMAGIDLEPNRGDEPLTNIRISNCLFLDNDRGMQAYLAHMHAESEPISVVWENNYVRGGTFGVLLMNVREEDSPRGTMIFRNNVVEGGTTAGLWIRNIAAGGIEVRFEGNTLLNVPGTPVVMGTAADTPARQGGVHFESMLIIDHQDRPAVVVDGQGKWVNVTGSMDVVNPHGARIEHRTPVRDFDLTLNAAMSGAGPDTLPGRD